MDKLKHEARISLAIEGKVSDGWYQMGKITGMNLWALRR